MFRPATRLIALALAVACDGPAEPGSGPTRERTPSGVEIVRNHAPSGWSDTSGWRLVESATIVPVDTGPGALVQPTTALLGDDGLVYVAEREPRSVKVFDRSGRWIRTIGRTGEGPGEFRYVMLGLHADTILVQDPILTRLTRFTTAGDLIDITPSPCCLVGPRLPVHRDGTLSVPFVEGWIRGRPGALRDTIRLPDAPDFGVQTVWTFGVADGPGGQLREASEPIPYSPSLESDVTPLGLVLWGATNRYALVVSRNGIDTARVIEAVGTPVPLSDSLRERAYQVARSGNGVLAYAGPLGAMVRKDDIPSTRPLWSSLRGDAAGRIWVALPDPERAVGRLAVFDSTGVLLGELPVPHRRILEGAWYHDDVVLIDEDDDGRPLIRIFTLEQ